MIPAKKIPNQSKIFIIKDSQSLKNIKKEFSSNFPNLKIEFSAIDQHSDQYTYDDRLLLSEIKTIHAQSELIVDLHSRVSIFIQNFQSFFGVKVHVNRKAGLWL